jgi:hypothetical protein
MLLNARCIRTYTGRSALCRTAFAVCACLQPPITKSTSISMTEDNTAKKPRLEDEAAKPGTADEVCWPHRHARIVRRLCLQERLLRIQFSNSSKFSSAPAKALDLYSSPARLQQHSNQHVCYFYRQ